MATAADVQRIALELPGMSEGLSFGTPAFRIGQTLVARFWEDLEVLAMKVDFGRRESLLAEAGEAFFLTEHYRKYPMVLLRVSAVDERRLAELLCEAWRLCAPRRLLDAHPDLA